MFHRRETERYVFFLLQRSVFVLSSRKFLSFFFFFKNKIFFVGKPKKVNVN